MDSADHGSVIEFNVFPMNDERQQNVETRNKEKGIARKLLLVVVASPIFPSHRRGKGLLALHNSTQAAIYTTRIMQSFRYFTCFRELLLLHSTRIAPKLIVLDFHYDCTIHE